MKKKFYIKGFLNMFRQAQHDHVGVQHDYVGAQHDCVASLSLSNVSLSLPALNFLLHGSKTFTQTMKCAILCFMVCFIVPSASVAQSSTTATKPAATSAIKSEPADKKDWKVKWKAMAFDPQIFVENKGQFDNDIKNKNVKKVLFQAVLGRDIKAYFTPNGIFFRQVTFVSKDADKAPNDKDGGKDKAGTNDIDAPHEAIVHKLGARWEGSNPNVTIEAGEEQTYYHSYATQDNKSVKANVFKKITYRNLYPGIDVVYTFPGENKEGIKYVVIVHPGADLSQVKLKYFWANSLTIDGLGNVNVDNQISTFTDHAPVSSYLEGGTVDVEYAVNGTEESFAVKGNYDKTKTLVIDPWTNPNTGVSNNEAYDIDYDNYGNVFVGGGYDPYQVSKFNSTGTRQWTTDVFGTDNSNSGYDITVWGDFAVDHHSGETYAVEGFNNNGAWAEKYDANGGFLARYNGVASFREMWRAQFNACTGNIAVGGGGTNYPTSDDQVAVLDTTMASLAPACPLCSYGVTGPGHDVCIMSMDPTGSQCFMGVVQSSFCDPCHPASSYTGPSQTNILPNNIFSVPLPSLSPVLMGPVTDHYNFQEAASISYVGNNNSGGTKVGNTNGMNGMAASPNWLYTFDGATLEQFNKSSGALNASVGGLGTAYAHGGCAADICDDVFVGVGTNIAEYNSSLAFQRNISAGGTVYAEVLGLNGSDLYACGNGFVEELANPDPVITFSPSSTNTTCGMSNGTATATLTAKCSIPGINYIWSNGQTTQTITGLAPGTYTCTMTFGGCGASFQGTVNVAASPTPTVGPTASPNSTICVGGSTTLNANGNGGVTGYSWTPTTGLSCPTCATTTANPTVTTTYSLTGSDGVGCNSAQETITVTVNPLPNVTASASSTSICTGSCTTLSSGGASTYTWSPAGPGSVCPASSTTYTVTGTDGNGCTNTGTVAVTVNPTPVPSITPTQPTCTTPGSATVNVTSGTPGYTYSWSPSGAGSSVSPIAPGSYTVTVTDANSCTGTANVTINSPAPPVITASAATNTVCAGQSTVLTATGGSPGDTYSWTSTTGLLNPNSDTTTATPSSNPTTWTVTVVNGTCTCTPVTVAVSINPSPTVTVSTSATGNTICSGDSATLTASGAGAGGTYVWSPATGLNTTTGTSVNTGATSTITYTVIGTDGNGCTNASSPATVAVTVNATPTVTAASVGICPNGTATLTAGTASGYNWSTGGTNDTIIVSPTATTTYTVIGNNGTCTDTTTATVTVGAISVTATASSDTVCSNGSPIVLTGGGANTYQWSGGPSSSTWTVKPTGNFTYTVTGTSGAGCSANATISIVVNPSPTLTLSSPSGGNTVCTGDTTDAFANVTGNAGPFIYTWSNNVPSNPDTTPYAWGLGVGTYSVWVTDTNKCNSDTGVFTVSLQNINVTINASSNSVCTGDSVTLTASGATNYTWEPGPASGSSIVVSPSVATTYTVVGTTTGTCKDSNTVAITVNGSPTMTVHPMQDSVCNGYADTITASGANSYVWNLPAPNNTGSTVSFTPIADATVIVTGKEANGCTATDTLKIGVVPPPTVNINLPGNDTICGGAQATLIANGSAGGSYSWDNGLYGTSDTIIVTPTTSPTEVYVSHGNGVCAVKDSVTIFLYDSVKSKLTPPDSGCAGKFSAILYDSAWSGKTPYSYAWSSTPSSVFPSFPPQGPDTVKPLVPTTYSCTVTDMCGTTSTSTTYMNIKPSPVARFVTSPSNPIPGGAYVAFLDSSTLASQWLWTFGEGITQGIEFPYYQYDVPGTYYVNELVTAPDGCQDSVTDTLIVIDSVYIPNVFTPSGNVAFPNNVFHVTVWGMKAYSIEIYNRWGQRVFTSDDPNIDWTGRSEGGVMESNGTYYYEITITSYSDKVMNYKGYVQLVGPGN
ncbi:MAG: gliding motility-associated C-terminal domain-containing protein [Bacteroidia bacterium]